MHEPEAPPGCPRPRSHQRPGGPFATLHLAQKLGIVPGVNDQLMGTSFLAQNANNLGLDMVICPGIEASEGDDLEIRGGELANVTTGKSYPVTPLPPARQAIIDAGGLIPYTRRRLLEGARV